MVGLDVGEGLRGAVRPDDFDLVEGARFAEAEVQVQVALGEVTAAAANLLELLLRAGGDADARVEGEAIVGGAFEGETYPVIGGVGFGFEDHGAADEVFDDEIENAAVEEIADGEASADLGDEDGFAGGGAHLAEGSVVLIDVDELWFLIGDAGLGVFDLRVDVAVDEDEVLPAGVVEIDEGVAPADVGDAGLGDAGLMRDVGEVEVAVVAIERRRTLR